MGENKMDVKTNKNKAKAFVAFVISLGLIISLVFTFVSGAFFKTSKTATGTLTFGSGIRATVTNLSAEAKSISDKTATLTLLVTDYNGTSYTSEDPAYKELKVENFENVSQSEYMVIANPTITPAEKTTDYYLRAKWLVKVEAGEVEGAMTYTEVALENLEADANIASLPTFLSTSWVLYDGYYYNVKADVTEITNTNDLNVNTYDTTDSATQKTITFFDTTSNGDRITFVDDNFNIDVTGLSIEQIGRAHV